MPLRGKFAALQQLSWMRAGRGDRISNVPLYLPLGFCLFLWLEARWHRATSSSQALGVAFLSISRAGLHLGARIQSHGRHAECNRHVTRRDCGSRFWGGLTD
jgi:hypothetical protein